MDETKVLGIVLLAMLVGMPIAVTVIYFYTWFPFAITLYSLVIGALLYQLVKR